MALNGELRRAPAFIRCPNGCDEVDRAGPRVQTGPELRLRARL